MIVSVLIKLSRCALLGTAYCILNGAWVITTPYPGPNPNPKPNVTQEMKPAYIWPSSLSCGWCKENISIMHQL